MTLETELQRLYNILYEDWDDKKMRRDYYRKQGDAVNAAYFDGMRVYINFLLTFIVDDYRGETGHRPEIRMLTEEEQQPRYKYWETREDAN